jgi:hypothetical protein
VAFHMHLAGCWPSQPKTHFVLTTLIQADAALPGSPSMSALPCKSAEPGQITFASTLRSANRSAWPAPAPLPLERVPVPVREKPAEKKTAEDSKPIAPVTSALLTATMADVKPAIPVIPFSLEPVPTQSPDITSSVIAPGPISAATTMSNAPGTIGFSGAFDQAQPGVAVTPSSQVRSDGPSRSSTPASGPGMSEVTTEASKGAPANDFVLQLNPRIAAAQPNRSPVSGATSALKQATGSDAVNQESAGISSLTPTRPADAAAASALLAAELAGMIANDFQVSPMTPAQKGTALTVEAAADTSASVNQVAQPALPSASQENKVGAESASLLPSPPVPGSLLPGEFGSVGLSKPISARSALPTRAADAIPASDPRAKENSDARVPANQEHALFRVSDPSSNSISPGAPPVTVLAHAQTGGDQPANSAAAANILPQVSTLTNQDSASRSGSGSAMIPPPPAASSPIPAPAAGAVAIARLVAGVTQSEMHIGMRTQAFGNVEVHTTVRDSQVGLTVGSERGDLRNLLATEVSGLQTAFRQHDLRFDNIHYLENSTGSGAGFSAGADPQPNSSKHGHSPAPEIFSLDNPRPISPELDIGAGVQAKLSVHA